MVQKKQKRRARSGHDGRLANVPPPLLPMRVEPLDDVKLILDQKRAV